MTTTQPSARTIANRANAQKSTGPKTQEGKKRSSQNALKHGLTAAKHVETIFDEPGEFQAFQTGLFDHFSPATAYETALVDRIIGLMWRLRRVPIIETAVMQGKIAGSTLHPSMAYLRAGGTLEFLHLSRYEANLDRCLHRALKDLADARTQESFAIVNRQSSIVNFANEGVGGGRSSECIAVNRKSSSVNALSGPQRSSAVISSADFHEVPNEPNRFQIPVVVPRKQAQTAVRNR